LEQRTWLWPAALAEKQLRSKGVNDGCDENCTCRDCGGNVVPFTGITLNDTSPASVLDGARKHQLDTVFVIGEKDGELYAAGSTSAVGDIMVLFEKFKREVI
jgi:hypothetical protein